MTQIAFLSYPALDCIFANFRTPSSFSPPNYTTSFADNLYLHIMSDSEDDNKYTNFSNKPPTTLTKEKLNMSDPNDVEKLLAHRPYIAGYVRSLNDSLGQSGSYLIKMISIRSYRNSFTPADIAVLKNLKSIPDGRTHPHLARWYGQIQFWSEGQKDGKGSEAVVEQKRASSAASSSDKLT